MKGLYAWWGAVVKTQLRDFQIAGGSKDMMSSYQRWRPNGLVHL